MSTKDKQQGEELLDLNEDGQVQNQKKEKEKQSSNPLKVIVPVVAIILLICGGVFGYKYLIPTNPLQKTRRCVVFGYGGVAMSTLPILNKEIKISHFVLVDRKKILPQELKVLDGIKFEVIQEDFPIGSLPKRVPEIIQDDDIVIDLFGCSESLDIVRACNTKKGIVYVDASLEEYEENSRATLYDIYKDMDKYNKEVKPKFTGCVDAGANPGMITHFSILALFHMAKDAIDRKVKDHEIIKKYLDEKNIKKLTEVLQVDALHISENDTLEPKEESVFDGYTVNTWCVDSFVEEWNINGEVSLGTKDREYMEKEGYKKIEGSIPTGVICPFPLYLKSTGPKGIFTGKVVRHPEVCEISAVFGSETHVPTVVFVYKPARLPRKKQNTPGFEKQPYKLITEEISGPLDGYESMGATLISSRDDIPTRYYGSVISAQQSREVGCTQNPTTLQVAAGILSHLIMGLREPERGLCMPHDFDSEEIMKIAMPYLGTVYDMNVKEEISSKWEDLISTQAAMDNDL